LAITARIGSSSAGSWWKAGEEDGGGAVAALVRLRFRSLQPPGEHRACGAAGAGRQALHGRDEVLRNEFGQPGQHRGQQRFLGSEMVQQPALGHPGLARRRFQSEARHAAGAHHGLRGIKDARAGVGSGRGGLGWRTWETLYRLDGKSTVRPV
jgi:hypothetical protein